MMVLNDQHQGRHDAAPQQQHQQQMSQQMSQQQQLELAQQRAEYLAREQELEDNIRRMQAVAAAALAGASSPSPGGEMVVNPGYQASPRGVSPAQHMYDNYPRGNGGGYIDVLGAQTQGGTSGRGASGMMMDMMATKPFSATATDVPDPDRYKEYEEDTRL